MNAVETRRNTRRPGRSTANHQLEPSSSLTNARCSPRHRCGTAARRLKLCPQWFLHGITTIATLSASQYHEQVTTRGTPFAASACIVPTMAGHRCIVTPSSTHRRPFAAYRTSFLASLHIVPSITVCSILHNTSTSRNSGHLRCKRWPLLVAASPATICSTPPSTLPLVPSRVAGAPGSIAHRLQHCRDTLLRHHSGAFDVIDG